MKRFLSAVLTLVMIASMFTTVSASLDASTGYIDNPLSLTLGMEVAAKKAEDVLYSTEGLAVTLAGEVDASQGIDYRATLNMGGIRALFSKPFVDNVLDNNQELMDEFNAGTVSTTINVAITYPEAAVIEGGADSLKLGTTGALSAGSTFAEVGERTLVGNTLNITYKNADGLKVSDLDDSISGQLKDITFTLEDKISYKTAGTHTVSVALTGETTIEFSSKTQTINYTGSSSHIANFTKDVVHHVLKVVPVKPATCAQTGTTEGIICETHNSYSCGATGVVEPEEIPQLTHTDMSNATIAHVDRVAATCVKKGVEEHYMCVLCKQDFDLNGVPKTHAEIEIPLAAHNTDGVRPAVAKTCTKDGLTEGRYCTVCGHVGTAQVVTAATGHIPEAITAVPATCTEKGLTLGSKCGECGAILIPQIEEAAKGHSFGEWVETRPATENEEGELTRTCDNCPVTETAKIPKLTHTHVASIEVVTLAPTCTTTGLKNTYCSCDQQNPVLVQADIVIPAIGHDMKRVSAVKATCTDTGIVEHYSCANCGFNYRDAEGKKKLASIVAPIDINGHEQSEIVTIAGVAPTCDKPGLTEGKKCSACNVVTKAQTSIAELGHVMEPVGKAATCTEEGVKTHDHCAVCDKDFDSNGQERAISFFTIPATGHSYGNVVTTPGKEPQEGVPGEGTKTCASCGDVKTVVIAALEHVHNEIAEEIIKPETCTANGKKRRIYACCGEVIQDNIVIHKHDHNLVPVEQISPDCHHKGKKAHYECTECHKLFSGNNRNQEITKPDEIEVTLHNFVDHTTYKECSICHEVIRYEHHNDAENHANVKGHGGIKNKEDRDRENIDRIDKVESHIIIDKRDEVSPKLDEVIPENVAAEKVVLDIIIEKITTYEGSTEQDKEIIPETEDLVDIEINIPVGIQGKEQYNVLRVHNGRTEEIKTTPNADGEYIVIGSTTIRLHVKKFSEYAVIAFEEPTTIITPSYDTPSSSSGGGGGQSTFTVRFNANGGSVVDSIKVKKGETVTAPIPTKEGYIFKGWYTDLALTELFDFSTPIKNSMVLYAAWEVDENAGKDNWFIDVPETEWFYTAVKYAFDNGLMNGISEIRFAPNDSITRAMFVTVLYRIENEPEVAASSFTDVEADTWYTDAVAWATEAGVTNGVSETEFAPNQNIIREQIAAMLYRYVKFKGYDVSEGEATNILSYTDAGQITEYAVPAFQWAVSDGIMNGKSATTLNPADNATRAEAAALLMRIIEKYSK